MPSFDLPPPVPYADPWNQPLAERLAMLAKGSIRIAYFYERADNSTFRYRIYNMAQTINVQTDGTAASYFFLDDLHRLDELAETAHLLVICRTRYDPRVNHLVRAFHKRGKRVLFDVDDLVFDLDYAHLIFATLDKPMREWDEWFAYIGRLGATLKLCDGAITTNEYLADRIRQFANLPVSVVPNYLNREQLELSDRVFAAKMAAAGTKEPPITFGYFSGSPSHNKDFAIASPALAELLAEDERLHVAVVGYIEAGPELAPFGNRVRRHPFQDFINLQRLIGSVDFNLMPLQHNTFTNCKSELKYFEAAVVGTQSIASPSYTYARSIRDGDNGYIAKAHQWYSVLKRALNEMDGYRQMAERSREEARREYAWFNQYPRIVAALGIGEPHETFASSRHHRQSLKSLHAQLRGKVSDKWSSYLDVYDGVFTPCRDGPVDLLEIGVQNGGSLELWARYFRRGKTFVGCDIDERCANLTFSDPRIRVVVGDATTAQAEARIAEQCPGFDIVIDDGSHRAGDMLSAFARYFELLKPGGVYCIEDAHTLYWQHFDDDRLLQLRARRFFRALADAVNYQHWRDAGAPEGPLAETSADTPWPDAVKQGWVDAVEFRNSLIFIRKAMHPGHDKLGTRLISGTRAVVDPQPLALRSAPADGEVSPSPQRSPVV